MPLKDMFKKNGNVYTMPGIFSAAKVLKSRDALFSLFIVYIMNFILYQLLGGFTIVNMPLSNRPHSYYWIYIIISIFLTPAFAILEYSSPLKGMFRQLKKYPAFLVYFFVLFILSIVFIFLFVIVAVGAAIVGGLLCLSLIIILAILVLFYGIYRIFAAPAYILLSYKVGGMEAISKSIQFTKKNYDALWFFIKFIIVNFVFIGIFRFPSVYTTGLGWAIFYFIYTLILFIMAASTTVFVHAYIERNARMEEDNSNVWS